MGVLILSLSVEPISAFLLFCAVGKLLLYLFQKFPPAEKIFERWQTTKQLFECDLCLGVWVYGGLSWLLQIYVFSGYIPVLSELITGAVCAFLMHLISLGWQTKYSIIEVK